MKLFDSEVIDITEIIVHPNYTKQADRFYNNIAVLKLKTFSNFRPQCILYGFSDYNKYQLPGFTPVSHGNNHLEGNYIKSARKFTISYQTILRFQLFATMIQRL